MKSLFGPAVRRGLFVAVEAKSGLRLPRERFMALATVLLELDVALNDRAGDDEFLQKGLRCSGAVHGNDEQRREQQPAFNTAKQYPAPRSILMNRPHMDNGGRHHKKY